MSNEPKTARPEPKPEAPKFENPFAAFDPIGYWSAVAQTVQRMAADGQVRAQAAADQYAALEAQLVERTQAAVATWAQLAQDTLAYGVQLSAEARRIGLDAYRKVSAGA